MGKIKSKKKIEEVSLNRHESNNTILKIIDEYIKSINYPFKDLYIKKTVFPQSFNEVIEMELKKNNADAIVDDHYQFAYDNNDNFVLVINSSNSDTRIVLLDDNMNNIDFDFSLSKVNFNRIIENSLERRYYESLVSNLKKIYSYRHPDIKGSKLNEEINAILEANKKFMDMKQEEIKSSYKDPSKYIFANYKNDQSGLDEYIASINKIKGYIGWLNKFYIDTVLSDNVETIEYTPNIDSDFKKNKTGEFISSFDDDKVIERNSVIPPEYRINVLKSLMPTYLLNANIKDERKNGITDFCYFYSLDENKYVIVIEPFNGNRSIKIIQLSAEKCPTYDEFRNLCFEYLEFPHSKLKELDNVYISYHTTKETYKKVMSYVTNRSNSQEINYITRGRIDEVKFNKIEEKEEIPVLK